MLVCSQTVYLTPKSGRTSGLISPMVGGRPISLELTQLTTSDTLLLTLDLVDFSQRRLQEILFKDTLILYCSKYTTRQFTWAVIRQ